MVSGVLVGLLALGEGMPRSGGRRALRLLSWLLILAGVTNLAGGGEGEGPAAAALRRVEEAARGARLPRGARAWLLRALRARGARGGKGGGLLANGHSDEGGPALPVVAAAPAAAAAPG
jgi:hypothetical protein